MFVVLNPKSKHGKDVINRDGQYYDLVKKKEGLFDKPGTCLLIKSQKNNDIRWVHENDDNNFVVSIVSSIIKQNESKDDNNLTHTTGYYNY